MHNINRPTRIDTKNNSYTIIDNFFTNFLLYKTSNIILSDISDHFPITLFIDLRHYNNSFKLIKNENIIKNLINPNTSSKFNTILSNTNWDY